MNRVKIGTNVKINLLSSENRRLNDDGEQAKLKVKPNVKSKEVDNQRLMVESEPDVKPKVITKPNIKPNNEHKQGVKPNIKFNQDLKNTDLLSSQFSYVEKRSKLNDKITYEEEKVALILGTTASPCLCHEICVDQNSDTCD